MKRTFEEALEHRRSYYEIGSDSTVEEDKVVYAIRTAVKHVPSAFNSQSTRIVLLLGDEHRRLWGIVKETLRGVVPEKAFPKTEAKIDGSFAGGHGTVLFLEDMEVVEKLQGSFPLYRDNFPVWAQHTSAMHQLAIWTMLEDLGLGASLQHYNPLIDEAVHRAWQLPERWLLVAEMPFGTPLKEPGPKEMEDLSRRVKVFS